MPALKNIKLFAHPLFIAGLITLISLPFILRYFPEYRAGLMQTNLLGKPNSVVSWGDFFNDGESELLEWFSNSEGKATFKLTGQNGYIIDVHVFDGQTLAPRNPPVIADLDGNGFDDIWSFYHRNDSLFLTKISFDQDSDKQAGKECFVSIVANPSGVLDYDVNFNYDLWDKYEEGTFVFCVNAGYPLLPRQVYKYYPADNHITRSAYMGATTGVSDIADLDGVGRKVYLLGQYAPGNLEDSLIDGVNDLFVRLVMLNDSLKTIWSSERFEGMYSSINTKTIQNDQHEKFVVALIKYKSMISLNDKLVVYTRNKRKFIEKEIPYSGRSIDYTILSTQKKGSAFGLFGSDGSITTFTTDLTEVEKRKLPVPGQLHRILDIDEDGEQEIVINNMGDISVLRSDFSQTVTIKTNAESPVQTLCSLKKNINKSNELCVQTKSSFRLIAYGRNNWFHLRYPAVLVYWFALSFLVFVIQYLQKLAFREKYLTERKMSEMQLLLLRNQINPHFLFNAINSISYRIIEKDPEEANNNIISLSRLLRNQLMASERFSRSLEEELEAAEAYVKIIRSQMEDPFQFSIHIGAESDLKIEVPVMVIQNYLENAIKHGIKMMGASGKITITSGSDAKYLYLKLTDNGIGRKNAAVNKTSHQSTGKGLAMMNQFFREVNKINDRKISVNIIDLSDDSGNPSGTEVLITIPLQMKYRMYEN